VKKIVPTADRSKATVMVKVSFDQLDNRVLPEMSAKISFLPRDTETSSVNTETVLTVPTDAVVSRNGVTQLFVIRQGRVSIRTVETGRTYGVVLEIKSGVNIGDIVVVSPPESLADGDTVKLKS
jgi:multidrug efflux pump subunit AcrA (membrane-fusion protein)